MNSTLYQASSFLPVEEIRYIATTQPYLFACGIFFSIAVSYTSMRSFFSIPKEKGFTHLNTLNVSFSLTLIILFLFFHQNIRNQVTAFWGWAISNYEEVNIFIGFYIFLICVYMFGAFLCAVADYFNLLSSYKILYDGKRFKPTQSDYIKVLKNLFLHYVLIALPMGYLSFPLVKTLGLDTSLELPDWGTFIFQIFMFYILEDFFHYCGHRFLHTTWCYQNIHKEHHLYNLPFGLTAVYCHWAEFIFLGVCTFLPPLLAVNPHFLTYFSWFILRQVDAVFTHSGYELPVPFLDLIPSFGGIPFHDYHHKAFHCNYGSRFIYLDKLFGTYKEPSPKEGMSSKSD